MLAGAVRVQEFPGKHVSCFAAPAASALEDIVGCSDELRRVVSHVRKVAATDATVLITGESGTGKEMIAQAIHENSRRAGRTFIKVNCAAIAPSLIASELFGYEKGAFTGAIQRHFGRFEAANGGTIFLDEIGDVPPETQIALLRVLQEREFERVGSPRAIPVDVRVVAATNRDLDSAIENGTFRSDLFYRLNVFPIHMPPLRDRAGDLPLLAQHFLHRFAAINGKKIESIDSRTLERLESYDWPGNIRELQNIVERAVILCDGDGLSIDEAWLQPRKASNAGGLTEALSSQQREMIESALQDSCGRISGPCVRHDWPRNIRELQNFIERSVILTNGRELRAPIEELTNQETHDGVVRTLNDAHRALIIKTLRQTNWLVGGPNGAAAKLGLKRTTLITKMRRLGISTGPAKPVRGASECDWDRSLESVAAPA